MEIILKAGREMPIFLDAIERLSICNIILLITKPLHKWVICSFLFSISITKLQCPLLCAVISSIYIIIITFIFTLLLLIMLQTVFIVILIIIIAIINIKNQPTFLSFKAFKVMINSSASMFTRGKSTFAAKKEWKWSVIFGLLALQAVMLQSE